MPDPTKPFNPNDPIPTKADSLLLLNNALEKISFYSNNPDYEKDNSYTGTDFNNPEFIKEVIKSYEHLPNSFSDLRRHFPGTQVTDSELASRFGKVTPNIYSAGDILSKGIDTRFNPKSPPVLFSPSIEPQGTDVFVSGTFSDRSSSPYYDILAITPWDMLSEEQKLKRVEKYGKSGVPKSYESKPQRPLYKQIPTKEPNIQSSLITEEQLTPTYIKPIIEYPKDVRRFTAGNYLESQGKSSGYVNYGKGEGQQDIYADGGVVLNDNDRAIDSFYPTDKLKRMDSYYPYRTLQNPSYKDVNIPQKNPHFMEPLREKKIQYRQVPMNIEDGTSMLDTNDDIGFLFNKKFGIQ